MARKVMMAAACRWSGVPEAAGPYAHLPTPTLCHASLGAEAGMKNKSCGMQRVSRPSRAERDPG
jgi:hypothetical protein